MALILTLPINIYSAYHKQNSTFTVIARLRKKKSFHITVPTKKENIIKWHHLQGKAMIYPTLKGVVIAQVHKIRAPESFQVNTSVPWGSKANIAIKRGNT